MSLIPRQYYLDDFFDDFFDNQEGDIMSPNFNIVKKPDKKDKVEIEVDEDEDEWLI